ncbi:LLM class flavin-dependent oxidoreductase [Pseudomonas putida]|uniref:LLM class flavin-dependent oxidoreductase n=1 Tax=Pseudomonas putida TaxID=303 RepID=A0A7W2L0H7_PSEPU|nr:MULTISPECIES: LLM class flavin-dependent oxidoreductase [Pseudomonas]MBA6116237.1 LLM class flavin-dependent oxidoreductase [Pseudomonas putida]MBI6942749.1 LLM class flavin-dependent oxidoreductase [Pseudomonas putida]MBI6958796.1 LLM class flavin-dependent oxidoreductase [Pseudomonas putida]MCZ9639118.1 LLM class flavin-dependent oxidoreductase [Pseudomonas putida]PZQ40199.1 MAG: nitrilotriacetate monooxygenase [Pseudomonas putida]
MTRRTDQLKLGAFLANSGHHVAAWRHPLAQADASLDFDHFKAIARSAERGRFDALFVADVVALWGHHLDALSRTARGEHFEPLTLMAALAAVTDNIGLIATATTSYNEPYHIARKFASLDHLSKGRAAWNLVTSVVSDEAWNFGRETHIEHTDRYQRAEEFHDVVKGLWDSWDDDAFVRDKASGQYFDPNKLHTLNHRGEHFSVRGPLNVARPPQGHPVLVQAGASESGKALAARVAEVIFAAHHQLPAAQAFYQDIKARAAALGRDPDHIKILPGVTPFIGQTREQAQALFEEFQALIDPVLGLRLLADTLGEDIDLSGFDLDGPLPDTPPGQRGSRREQVLDLARNENLTIRQLYLRLAGGNPVIGTAEDIADSFETWFQARACDGFNVFFPYFPGSIDVFVDKVIPLLQARGLFRHEYEGRTLRENLGLPRPTNRFSRPAQVPA